MLLVCPSSFYYKPFLPRAAQIMIIHIALAISLLGFTAQRTFARKRNCIA